MNILLGQGAARFGAIHKLYVANGHIVELMSSWEDMSCYIESDIVIFDANHETTFADLLNIIPFVKRIALIGLSNLSVLALNNKYPTQVKIEVYANEANYIECNFCRADK